MKNYKKARDRIHTANAMTFILIAFVVLGFTAYYLGKSGGEWVIFAIIILAAWWKQIGDETRHNKYLDAVEHEEKANHPSK